MSAVSLHKHKTKPTLLHVKVQITPEIKKTCTPQHLEVLLDYIDISPDEYTNSGYMEPQDWEPQALLDTLVKYHALNKNPNP